MNSLSCRTLYSKHPGSLSHPPYDLRSWIRFVRDIRESPNAVGRSKALFGAQDLVEKSRIWFSNVGFALCIRKTNPNRL